MLTKAKVSVEVDQGTRICTKSTIALEEEEEIIEPKLCMFISQ